MGFVQYYILELLELECQNVRSFNRKCYLLSTEGAIGVLASNLRLSSRGVRLPEIVL